MMILSDSVICTKPRYLVTTNVTIFDTLFHTVIKLATQLHSSWLVSQYIAASWLVSQSIVAS